MDELRFLANKNVCVCVYMKLDIREKISNLEKSLENEVN